MLGSARKIILLAGIFHMVYGQNLTLEDIFIEKKYEDTGFDLVGWLKGSEAYLLLEDGQIVQYNTADGTRSELFSATQLDLTGTAGKEIDFVHLSADGTWLMVGLDRSNIWRWSREAHYYLHNLKTGKSLKLAAGDVKQISPDFSPDSRRVAYVMGGDLYVYDTVKGRTRRLTKDGSAKISNGQADWLYEEEFGMTRAYEWSPDGRHIAMLRFDQTPIKPMHLIDQLTQYPTIKTINYPKVGETNSIIKLGVIPVDKGRVKWVDFGGDSDVYIPRFYWTGQPAELAFYRLNRRQHNLELVRTNWRSGASNIWASQTDPAWVEVTDDLHLINDGKDLIWTTEDSGYRHIYLLSSGAREVTAVTSGDWEVSSIVDVDEPNSLIYFYGKRDGIMNKHFYRVALDGSGLERLSSTDGWYDIKLAPDKSVYIASRSSVMTPSQISLHQANGEQLRWIDEYPNPAWDALELPEWKFFDLTTSDGVKLSAMILKPANFDTMKKYPTLIFTYGGPGSQAVRNMWGRPRFRWHQYMAQNGYVIVTVDNRGTGGRGKEFMNLAYGDLGKWSLNDQIETADWVGKQSWGDADRIGIWGWSGGGYMTALAMTKGAGHFKAGAAVAPVTDFRLYDTAWTERYMGLLHENETGYENANILNYVGDYKGDLLLIHGTGDDNVHPQHTWQLAQRIVEANKPIDVMMYPNQTHSISKRKFHLFSKLTDFFKERL